MSTPELTRSGSKRAILLNNYATATQSIDTLKESSAEKIRCDEYLCKGSLMSLPVSRKPGEVRTREELVSRTKGFIDDYYKSMKRSNTPGHIERRESVLKEIESSGTYRLTDSELVYGAKTAWRNSPRCIGRIQWAKLQVFDARDVTTATEMFEAMCNHIKYATNKGNIRSAITVFPQRTDPKSDFRVWNPQFLSYAGYRNEDGTINGDPINVEFTDVCLRLGWSTDRTAYDILPLVLQAGGNPPELFVIPKDLVLEIDIVHPQYPIFSELGIKWYVVPGVSNMMFDCGGLEFPAAPFNGWYMSTEIGARDLCDPQRRNLLEPIAKGMGLDTSTNVCLWKDRACIEANFAVLHSFQSKNITVVDHHTASESFMKHLANETRLRGGCPSDWVWVVPPISGSLTQVFHQEMLLYRLDPSYEYQVPAWKTYKWDADITDGSGSPRKTLSKHKFREIAKAVKFTSNLYGKALSRRIRATILYGTETGRSETFSRVLENVMSFAFNVKVHCMQDYDFADLEHETLVLFVTSTSGNGDPPENAEHFAKQLYSVKLSHKDPSAVLTYPLDTKRPDGSPVEASADLGTSDAPLPLSNIRFGVFALGSSAYPNFCSFGKYLNNLLGELGGERILRLVCGDEQRGQEQTFNQWVCEVFQSSCETFCIDDSDLMLKATADVRSVSLGEDNLRLHKVPEAKDRCSFLSSTCNKKVSSCEVISVTHLHPHDGERETICVRLSTSGNPDLEYQPGDHLGVYAKNRKEIVEGILTRLEDCPPRDQPVQLEALREFDTPNGRTSKWEKLSKFPPSTVEQILTCYVDITTPPSTTMLEVLSSYAADREEKSKLLDLSQNAETYEEWVAQSYPHLYDVLLEFPSTRPPASVFMSCLQPLQPRFYSISSSLAMHPGEVHLTVAVVRYQVSGRSEPTHYGVCSNYLKSLEPGDKVPCFVRNASAFHMPIDVRTPVIMVGPGTGIAPFRSFWQHRSVSTKAQKSNGDMTLFFGCRNKLVHLYQDETSAMLEEGSLTVVHTAYSREPGVPKTYVQDNMKESASFVYDALFKRDGHLYVCGDCTMAEGVFHTLKDIICMQNDGSSVGTEDLLQKLRNECRYHEDIFGITLRTAEVQRKSREAARSVSGG